MTAPISAGALPRTTPIVAAMLAALIVVALCPMNALAYMKIEGLNGVDNTPSPLYDRFQNDPSFIGNVMNASGVAMTFQPSGQSLDWATMISPSYFISAWHEHPGGSLNNNRVYSASDPNTQLTLRFYDSNDQTGGHEDYTNNPNDARTFTTIGEIGNGDLWLGKLSTPVSSQVAKYPILANASGTDSTNFYNTNPIMYTFGVGTGGSSNPNGVYATNQRVGRNQIDHKFLSGSNLQSVFPDVTDLTGQSVTPTTNGYNFRWFYASTAYGGYSHNDLGADESMVNGGDSGAPDFINLSPYSTAAIVGVNWFQFTIGSTGIGSGSTFVPGYIATGKPTQFSLSTLEAAMYGSGEQPSLVSTTPLKGDFNLDGRVTVADSQAMMTALANLSGYEQLHGVSASYVTTMGDFNGDGLLTNADLQGLIILLADGGASLGSSATAVPEPASILLLVLGALAIAFRGRSR